MRAPTFSDLFRLGRDEALARHRLLSLEVIEREGTDVNALLAASATMGEDVAAQLANADAAKYLDSAEKADLERLVFDWFGLLKKQASASFGTVTFTIPAPATVALPIPANTELTTADGIRFVTTAACVIAVGVSSVTAASTDCAAKSTLSTAPPVPARVSFFKTSVPLTLKRAVPSTTPSLLKS